jgi:hypothetical protein
VERDAAQTQGMTLFERKHGKRGRDGPSGPAGAGWHRRRTSRWADGWGADFVEALPTAPESGCQSGRGNGYFKIEDIEGGERSGIVPYVRRLAPITAAAGEILEHHRRARSPAGETIKLGPRLGCGGFWTAR